MAPTFTLITMDRFAYIDDFMKKFKFSNYIDQEFLRYYESLLRRGKIEEAIQAYNKRIPYEVSYIYTKTIQDLFQWAVDREIPRQEIAGVSVKLGLYTRQARDVLVNSMRSFTTSVTSKAFYQMHGLSDAKLQKAILDTCLEQFAVYTDGAMSQTPSYVLNHIRQIQTEWIIRNQAIAKNYRVGELLEASEAEFKDRLQKKFPHIFKDIKDGKILKSRLYGKDLDRAVSYTLEEYNEMATRATILNIDRNTCEMAAQVSSEKVVEYFVRDDRKIVTQERQVCLDLMKKKIAGKSLLALDDETGARLKIRTLTQAKQEGAMFLHCQHSIRRLSAEFLEELDKVLFLQQQMTERTA